MSDQYRHSLVVFNAADEGRKRTVLVDCERGKGSVNILNMGKDHTGATVTDLLRISPDAATELARHLLNVAREARET